MYSPVAYFMARNMVDTPAVIIAPLMTLLVCYWGIGYTHFLKIFLTMFLVAQCALGMGLLISSFSPNVTTATSIAPLFTMPFILFGGFIANTATTPDWLGWIQWISPIRYGNEAMAHS